MQATREKMQAIWLRQNINPYKTVLEDRKMLLHTTVYTQENEDKSVKRRK